MYRVHINVDIYAEDVNHDVRTLFVVEKKAFRSL